MKCPICNSESCEVLKTKGKTVKEYLLKCNKCGNTFRETVNIEKPLDVRVVVSEFEKTHKSFIKVNPDEILQVGYVLDVDERPAEITSLENKRGGRIYKSPVGDLETIWASYIDIPIRVGISVDYGGRVQSQKVEVKPDLEFRIGDIVKMGNIIFRINSLKTLERKLRKGFARASVTKRVYGRPAEDIRYKYDLTSKVIQNGEDEEE